jgi:hypothetical protein
VVGEEEVTKTTERSFQPYGDCQRLACKSEKFNVLFFVDEARNLSGISSYAKLEFGQ